MLHMRELVDEAERAVEREHRDSGERSARPGELSEDPRPAPHSRPGPKPGNRPNKSRVRGAGRASDSAAARSIAASSAMRARPARATGRRAPRVAQIQCDERIHDHALPDIVAQHGNQMTLAGPDMFRLTSWPAGRPSAQPCQAAPAGPPSPLRRPISSVRRARLLNGDDPNWVAAAEATRWAMIDPGQERLVRPCRGAALPRPARRQGGRPHLGAYRPARAGAAARAGHRARHRQLGAVRGRGRGRRRRPDRPRRGTGCATRA